MRYFSKLVITVLCGVLPLSHASERHDLLRHGAVASARALPHESGVAGYTEYYLDEPQEKVVRAHYYAVDGRPIAHKRLRYLEPGAQPHFELHDYRNSTGYRVIPSNGSLRIQKLRLLENNYQAVVDVHDMAVVEPTVIDAGIHRFILQHWQPIAAGEKIDFNFLQIEKARLIPMHMERVDCVESRYLCVRVRLNNPVYRLFVPPVLLTYDKRSKRLLNYAGFGPLPAENGEALAVTLNYQYKK